MVRMTGPGPDLGWRATVIGSSEGRSWDALAENEREEIRAQTGRVPDEFLRLARWRKKEGDAT